MNTNNGQSNLEKLIEMQRALDEGRDPFPEQSVLDDFEDVSPDYSEDMEEEYDEYDRFDEQEEHHDAMADMADMWRKSRQEDRS